MTAYRLYFLDAANHILGVEILESGSDAEAIEAAGRLARHGDFELWDRDRLVGRLIREGGGGARTSPPEGGKFREGDFPFGVTFLEAAD